MAAAKTSPKVELKPKVGLVLGDIVTINRLNYKVKRILNRGRLVLKRINAN